MLIWIGSPGLPRTSVAPTQVIGLVGSPTSPAGGISNGVMVAWVGGVTSWTPVFTRLVGAAVARPVALPSGRCR